MGRAFLPASGQIRLILPVLRARACQPAAGRLKTDTGWKTGSRMEIPPYRGFPTGPTSLDSALLPRFSWVVAGLFTFIAAVLRFKANLRLSVLFCVGWASLPAAGFRTGIPAFKPPPVFQPAWFPGFPARPPTPARPHANHFCGSKPIWGYPFCFVRVWRKVGRVGDGEMG